MRKLKKNTYEEIRWKILLYAIIFVIVLSIYEFITLSRALRQFLMVLICEFRYILWVLYRRA